MRYRQITIIGSGDDDRSAAGAYKLGRHIAEKGWVLVTGGRGGIMESASKGASEANGIVIGIIPGSGREEANSYCSIVIPSGIGHARNMINVLSGEVIIAMGGGWGTLSEIAYSQIFGRPIILCEFSGGWSEKMPRIEGKDTNENIHIAEKLEDVFKILDELLC